MNINLDRVLQEIQDKELVTKLRLCTGNCGIFAIALRNLLGKGEFLRIGGFAHIVLKLDEFTYVDGTGKSTLEELLADWSYWGPASIIDDEESIQAHTRYTYDIDQMETIISRLSRGQDISEFYDQEGRSF